MNTLYYGDNLDIMKEHIKDESVELIYLDPPFQSGRNYNIIFKPEKDGIKAISLKPQRRVSLNIRLPK